MSADLIARLLFKADAKEVVTEAGAAAKAVDGVNDAAKEADVGLKRAAKASDELALAEARAEIASGKLRAAQDQLAKVQQDTTASADALAKAELRVLEASTAAASAQSRAQQVQLASANATRLHSHESINLVRQLNDVVTMAAMGANPMMILASQSGQVVQVFTEASARGVTVSSAMKQLWGQTVGLAAAYGPLILTAGAVATALWGVYRVTAGMTEVSAANTRAIKESEKAADAYTKAVQAAQAATGSLRAELLLDAQAARENAVAKQEAARRNLDLAKAALAAAQASQAADKANPLRSLDVDSGWAGLGFMGQAAGAQAQVTALQKGLKEAQRAVQQADDALSRSGRTMLESLQRQNAEFGKTRGQIILMNAAAEAGKRENAAYADQIMAAARTAAAHADAEDARRKSLKGGADEVGRANKAAADYVKSQREQQEEIGKTAYEVDLLRVNRAADAMAAAGASAAIVAAMRAQGRATAELRHEEELRRDMRPAGAEQVTFNHGSLSRPDGPQVADQVFTGIGDRAEYARQAMEDVTWSVDGVFNALKGRDWAGATSGILNAVKSIQSMRANGGFTTGNALAMGAQVAGGMIGGTAGGILSAAGAGASLGSVIPGVGTAIGAGVGALVGLAGSLFGGSSKKKQAQEEARQRAEAQEQQRRQLEADTASQNYSLRIDVARAGGDDVEVKRLTREAELREALDETNRQLIVRRHALEDEAEATAKAAEAAEAKKRADDEHRSLEIRYYEAIGDKAKAAELRNGEFLDGLDDLNRAYGVAVLAAEATAEATRKAAAAEEEAAGKRKAASDLGQSVGDQLLQLTDPDAYRRQQIARDVDAMREQAKPMIAAGLLSADVLTQLDNLQQLRLDEAFKDLGSAAEEAAAAFARSKPQLQRWLDQLAVGPLSGLNPSEQRQASMASYERLLERARARDPEAMGQITGAAEQLLNADRSATSSAAQRAALRSKVQGDISGLIGLPDDAAATTIRGKVEVANIPALREIYASVAQDQTTDLSANLNRLGERLGKLQDALEGSLDNLNGAVGHGFDEMGVALQNGLAGVVGELVSTRNELAAMKLADRGRM